MTAFRWAAIGIVILVSGAADARWKAEYGDHPPEIQAWYRDQHNAKGEWCCNESDGHPYYGDYSINEDGSVTLYLGGETRNIPAYMVLKGPNPTGHAVWWYLKTGSTLKDYCFAPGMLS